MAIWIECTAKVDGEEVPAIYRPRNQDDVPSVGEKHCLSVKLGDEWKSLQCRVELVKVGTMQWAW